MQRCDFIYSLASPCTILPNDTPKCTIVEGINLSQQGVLYTLFGSKITHSHSIIDTVGP